MTLPPSDVKEVVERVKEFAGGVGWQLTGDVTINGRTISAADLHSLLAYITRLEEENAGLIEQRDDLLNREVPRSGRKLKTRQSAFVQRLQLRELGLMAEVRHAESRLQALSAAVEGVRKTGALLMARWADEAPIGLAMTAHAQALSELEKAGMSPSQTSPEAASSSRPEAQHDAGKGER